MNTKKDCCGKCKETSQDKRHDISGLMKEEWIPFSRGKESSDSEFFRGLGDLLEAGKKSSEDISREKRQNAPS